MDTNTNSLDSSESVAESTGSPFLDEVLQAVRNAVPDGILNASVGVDMPALVVPSERVVDVCRVLRDAPGLKFALLSDLTAVDYLDRDPRFDVVYHLYSYERQAYLRLKTGVPANPCVCPTMTVVWPGANWLEREVFDMFGIVFKGHPNLDRILTPEGWQYFPLRRDFPLQGAGMVKLYDNVKDIF